MRSKRIVNSLLIGFTLLMAACTAVNPPATPTVEVMESGQTAVEVLEEKPEGEAASEEEEDRVESGKEGEIMEETEAPDDAMQEEMGGDRAAENEPLETEAMAGPDWFDRELVNVRSGESFTINDYQGKVLLVETMAIWCSNCLQQQRQVLELHNMLGERDDFVSIGLDIDPFEQAPDLKTYIENNGFHWVYAVSPKETSQELSQLYGQQYLNPPSTPMLIIDRQGEAHTLPFGIKSAADLQQALEPFLNDGS